MNSSLFRKSTIVPKISKRSLYEKTLEEFYNHQENRRKLDDIVYDCEEGFLRGHQAIMKNAELITEMGKDPAYNVRRRKATFAFSHRDITSEIDPGFRLFSERQHRNNLPSTSKLPVKAISKSTANPVLSKILPARSTANPVLSEVSPVKPTTNFKHPERKFSCKVVGCTKTYKNVQVLREHVKKKHPGAAVPNKRSFPEIFEIKARASLPPVNKRLPPVPSLPQLPDMTQEMSPEQNDDQPHFPDMSQEMSPEQNDDQPHFPDMSQEMSPEQNDDQPHLVPPHLPATQSYPGLPQYHHYLQYPPMVMPQLSPVQHQLFSTPYQPQQYVQNHQPFQYANVNHLSRNYQHFLQNPQVRRVVVRSSLPTIYLHYRHP